MTYSRLHRDPRRTWISPPRVTLSSVKCSHGSIWRPAREPRADRVRLLERVCQGLLLTDEPQSSLAIDVPVGSDGLPRTCPGRAFHRRPDADRHSERADHASSVSMLTRHMHLARYADAFAVMLLISSSASQSCNVGNSVYTSVRRYLATSWSLLDLVLARSRELPFPS